MRQGAGWRQYCAEAIGTFAIVVVGAGVGVANTQAGLTEAALASGLTVMAMIYTFGHISGAHFNPAVTLAFALARHFPRRAVPGYLCGQLSGAIVGAALLRLIFGDAVRAGVTLPGNKASVAQAAAIEMILSFFLMLVITAVATDTRAVGQAAAIAIGVTVICDILLGGTVSGASMNPARSFGPALVVGEWRDQWLYWLCPIAGAALGALTYGVVRAERH